MPQVSATSFKPDFPTLKRLSCQVISISYYEFTLWVFFFFVVLIIDYGGNWYEQVIDDKHTWNSRMCTPNNTQDSSATEWVLVGCEGGHSSSCILFGIWGILAA